MIFFSVLFDFDVLNLILILRTNTLFLVFLFFFFLFFFLFFLFSLFLFSLFLFSLFFSLFSFFSFFFLFFLFFSFFFSFRLKILYFPRCLHQKIKEKRKTNGDDHPNNFGDDHIGKIQRNITETFSLFLTTHIQPFC